MPKVHFKRRIRHTPDDMLSLVTNVEDYPTYINLISVVRILSRESIGENKEKFIADVGVQYKFISEFFCSEVNVDKAAKTLSIGKAGHGSAVRQLKNNWKFLELGDGSTLIDFRLDVKMKAAPLEFLIKIKFDKAAESIINAFERRADQIFEKVGDETYDHRNEISI
ncbi:MAG: SRPBCC family protein [Robiginitomaculum sp.]